MLQDSTVSSLGAIPGAFNEVANSFSVPRLVEEASPVRPSSAGCHPVLCARPGAGPRHGTGSFGVGVLVP
eukprot:4118944-Pyramimonas_sp.AAC.1